MKNIFNFFNRKADYTAKKNDLANDAISFVVDEHKIYVKDQWFGGSGDGSGSGSGESTVIENPYDDTEVRGLISDVNDRLDNLVLLTQQDVQNTVTSMIADMRSFIDNFGWDAMFNDSGWDEEMRAYIQTVGFTDSENNQVSWSQFYQDFKTLQSVVNQINIGGTDEDINYETIQAMINSTIDGNTAINGIKSKWALADENEKVLKWLASGFTAQANQGGSFAQVYAAGQNANTTAISALETRVDGIEDDVDSNATAISSLSTRVDNAISGLVTQAALNNATSAIYSQIDNVTAAIATAVKKDANGKIESGVSISADQIYLDGITWFDLLASGSSVDDGGISASLSRSGINFGNDLLETDTHITSGHIEVEKLGAGSGQGSTVIDGSNITLSSSAADSVAAGTISARTGLFSKKIQLDTTHQEWIETTDEYGAVTGDWGPATPVSIVLDDNGVTSPKFINSSSSDSEVLLGGGGTKPLSEFATFNNGNLFWDENGNIRIGDDLDDENLHSYKGVSLTKDLFKIGYQEESVDVGLTFDTSTNSLSISEDEGHHSYKGINISPSGLVLNATSAAILLSLTQTSRDLARQASNINITTDQIPNYVHTLINKSGIYTQLPIKTTESVQAPSVQVESELIIGDGAIVSVPTPAGNGLYTPNEGYTGTINGARFVKGICIGAA